MSCKQLQVDVCDKNTWLRYEKNFSQYGVFSLLNYWELVANNFIFGFIRKGNEIEAGFFLNTNISGTAVTENSFCIYSGLFFSESQKYKNKAKASSREFEVTVCFSDFLNKNYASVDFCLHYSHTDLRPFLWEGYGLESHPIFSCRHRYTSILDISHINSDFQSWIMGVSKLRRQMFRKAGLASARTEITSDVSGFVKSFRVMSSNNEMELDNGFFEKLPCVLNYLNMTDKAVIFETTDAHGQICYRSCFFIAGTEATYMFGVRGDVSPEWSATKCLVDAFVCLQSRGVKIIDLEGVNSPDRGWFKLGFGGSLQHYAQICKNI